MKIILASASPRRRELLKQIGLDFEVRVSDVEEKVTTDIPHLVVEELSAQKAAAVMKEVTDESLEEIVVIGADTIVACDGKILGKPKDEGQAVEMLKMLQGRAHQVYTGVTLLRRTGKSSVEKKTFHEETSVFFYPMSEKEIRSYVATKDPLDKAGAYGIQGLCARYIREIKGDYNNVVGLPVGRLFQELKDWLHRKKAVIFDLDGTLLDTIQSLEYCGNRALEPFGYGPFPAQDYKYFVGDGAANLIKRALIKGGDKELVHFDEALKRYKDYFREDCMYKVEPYPGIPELIEQLKKEGIQTAVLSNKPHAETVRMIDAFFGKDCFDVVFGQRDGVAIKPSPDGVYQILEQLKLKPEQILYIGDTATDMKTGKGAGAFTIGALWGFRTREELEENKADAIIDNPLDLLNYL